MPATLCPRCSAPLQMRFGDLGEDVCGGCDGRLLSPMLTRRVLIEEGGIDPAVVKDLAEHYGGTRLPCPLCVGRMSPVTLKGTAIDVCLGCGATFLDAGELSRLSAGRHREVLGTPPAYPLVERSPQEVEPPADPRTTWEKAMPMYAVEAAALFPFCYSRGYGGGSALGALGAALGITAIPLCLSMLVDFDLRALLRPRDTFWSHRYSGYRGTLLVIIAVAVGGVVSTVNAAIAERLPKKIARWGTVAVLGAVAAFAVGMALTGR